MNCPNDSYQIAGQGEFKPLAGYKKKESPGQRHSNLLDMLDASRKILSSATSIKAGTTSLLSHEIIWDAKNRYELLEIIDSSTDQLTELATVFMLTLRAEANLLQQSKEPYELREILMNCKRQMEKKYPQCSVDVKVVSGGKLVCVDYEYLALALLYLSEVIKEAMTTDHIHLEEIEYEDHWSVIFRDLDTNTKDLLEEEFSMPESTHREVTSNQIPSWSSLKLHLAKIILNLQGICGRMNKDTKELEDFQLDIPVTC